ncbi:MAG: hypothetical protein KatS3mg027_2039 [Bacteroidia bacterium]|nr:MAG: hypothetical protein KatS3mg027_2039 [Bacteroidia bacterium]
MRSKVIIFILTTIIIGETILLVNVYFNAKKINLDYNFGNDGYQCSITGWVDVNIFTNSLKCYDVPLNCKGKNCSLNQHFGKRL